MRIGIDISQIVYEGTGVGRYVQWLVEELLKVDKENEYILFGASLRRRDEFYHYFNKIYHLSKHVRLVVVPLPPTFLDLLWNKLHVFPIEWFIGQIDVFWSSDWTQPPLRAAHGVTTIHDVSFLKYPESFDRRIRNVQKRRLSWVKKECQAIFCDSEATKKDVVELVGIPAQKCRIVYPGFR